MNPNHNLKFIEAAVLRLQSELATDIARLEGLLKDPSASTHHSDLVDTICDLAHQCVSATGAIQMLQNSIPSHTPGEPVNPPLTEEDLKARSAVFRKSVDAGTTPPKKKKKKS
jgi:hypothetical protein